MMLTKTITLLAMASLGTVTAAAAAEDTEQPEYTVVGSADGVELRSYAPHIVAEVTVEAPSRDAASGMGFRPLAGYIFGGNTGSDEIAMTAPVTTQPAQDQTPEDQTTERQATGTRIAMTAPVTTGSAGEGRYIVRFSMPRSWTMETLPTPDDPSVTVREIPAETRLAYRFTGAKSRAGIDAADAAITAYAARNALTLASDPIVAGYDGPGTPPAKRRWEVMRIVADE